MSALGYSRRSLHGMSVKRATSANPADCAYGLLRVSGNVRVKHALEDSRLAAGILSREISASGFESACRPSVKMRSGAGLVGCPLYSGRRKDKCVSEPQAATRQNRSAQGSIFAPPSRRGRPGRFTKAVMKNSRRSRVRYQAKPAQTPPSRRATSSDAARPVPAAPRRNRRAPA